MSCCYDRCVVKLLVLALTTACHGPAPDLGKQDPPCRALPAKRPAAAILKLARVDGESLTHTIDVALVADAPCPHRPTLEDPTCIRLTDEAMDYVWHALVAIAPHTIALQRHDQCIHCGGNWITIEWAGGTCSRGNDHFFDVAQPSQQRFERAVQILAAAAAAGGVKEKAPPR